MRASCCLTLMVLLSVTGASLPRRPASDTVATGCDGKGCSHECVSLGEFPVCSCPPEMALDKDGKTCKDNVLFLLAMFRGIRLYNPTSFDDELSLSVAPVKARSIDYHYGNKELYAYTNYTIMRYPLSRGKTASPVTMVTSTDTSVTSMAVDWVHDVIYYISEQQSAIGAISLEGGDQRTILTHNGTSIAEWQSLVVDPHAKKLFWVGNGSVYSSSLDGKDLKTDLISGLKPDRITLDHSKQLIYAIGSRRGKNNKYIARASYNGEKSGEDVEIDQPVTASVFGFGVVGDTAYWESNHDGENLYKCGLGRGGNTEPVEATVVEEINQIVYDMKVYHRDAQKPLS